MTLSSQLPRSSSSTTNSKSRLIPIALALLAAGGVAGATYFFSRDKDMTPSGASLAKADASLLPSIKEPTANPPQMPEVLAPDSTKTVSVAIPVAVPTPAPAAPVAPIPVAANPTVIATAPAVVAPQVTPAAAVPATTLSTALALVNADPVGARLALTQLVDANSLAPQELAQAFAALRELNAKLVFSPTVAAGDPFMRTYTVASGDTLSKIAKANDVQTDWRFLQRINGMKNERALRVGQKLKIPTCAFHAEVSKSSYLMRVYAGEGANRVLVAAYTVGLGELNSTPTGAFMVRPKSKLVNPEWNNPRTGEHFAPDNPKNPIGERWIGLMGVEANNQGFKGYGIHGTIEPDSIGKQASMGCVRMSDADVETVYELLTEPNSTIIITP